jgi:phosphatidylserine synthase
MGNKALSFPYGPANAVTLLRMTALLAVTLIHPVIPDILLGILFTLICLGDLLDGYLARTFKMNSTIGEYMDKETDALFVLCTTFVLFQKGFTGVWIVSLGLVRYVYFIAVFYFLKPGRKNTKTNTPCCCRCGFCQHSPLLFYSLLLVFSGAGLVRRLFVFFFWPWRPF